MGETDLGFLSFERVEIEESRTQKGHTSYSCRIKSRRDGVVIEISAMLALPDADRKLSELQSEIALQIHEATDPARLAKQSS
jgi:hypothetical protein